MVYEFKVVLDEIMPSIWRLIQVPDDFTFWDLHVAIQDSMGWKDCHKHRFVLKDQFSIQNDYFGVPIDLGIVDDDTKPDWLFKISDFISFDNPVIDYEYDFGNFWSHSVILFRIVDEKDEEKYPRCIDGARACPPEDCSIVGGYDHLVKVLKNPNHRDYKIIKNWLTREGYDKYDPEKFDLNEIKFHDSKKKLNNMYF